MAPSILKNRWAYLQNIQSNKSDLTLIIDFENNPAIELEAFQNQHFTSAKLIVKKVADLTGVISALETIKKCAIDVEVLNKNNLLVLNENLTIVTITCDCYDYEEKEFEISEWKLLCFNLMQGHEIEKSKLKTEIFRLRELIEKLGKFMERERESSGRKADFLEHTHNSGKRELLNQKADTIKLIQSYLKQIQE